MSINSTTMKLKVSNSTIGKDLRTLLSSVCIAGLLSVGLVTGVSAQIRTTVLSIDSMTAALDTASNDESRFMLHLTLAEELLSVDASRCLFHALQALDYEEFSTGWVAPYLLDMIGLCHDDLGQYGYAVTSYRQAIELTELLIASDEEEDSFLEVVTEDGWRYEWDLVIFYNNMGYSHYNTGDYIAALDSYLKAEELALDYDCPDITVVYGSLAELYVAIDDKFMFGQYISKLRNSITDSTDLMFNAEILGSAYMNQGYLDSARMCYEYLLSGAMAPLSNYDRAMAFKGLSSLAIEQGRYELAQAYADSCLDAATRLKSVLYESQALALKAEALAGMGSWGVAIPMLEGAIDRAERTGSNNALDSYYEAMAGIYSGKGDYRRAYDFRVRSDRIRDSLLNMNKINQLAQFTMQRELERQNEITAQLQAELSRDRWDLRKTNLFGIAMFLFVLLSAVAGYLIVRRRSRVDFGSSPTLTYKPKDNKLLFLQRVVLTIGLLLLLPMAYSILVGQETASYILAIALALCALVYFLTRITRSTIPPIAVLMMGYVLLAVSAYTSGPIPTTMIWILTLFLILAYSLGSVRWQVLNAILALATYFAFIYLGGLSNISPAPWRDPLDTMLGVVSLGTAFIALYYYKGDLFDYELGLNRTSSFLRLVADLNPNFIFAKDQNRRYLFANNAMVESHGLPLENILGKLSEDVNPAFAENPQFRDDDLTVLTSRGVRCIYPRRWSMIRKEEKNGWKQSSSQSRMTRVILSAWWVSLRILPRSACC